MANQFERIVELTPAFDMRDPNPAKNYGIHPVELRMILKGERGAVQFVLHTGWHLSHVHDEFWRKHLVDGYDWTKPYPADLGYHSRYPIYEGQEPLGEDCPYVPGGVCYYDGSTLNAEPLYEVLLKEGSEGIWRHLEAFYHETFAKFADLHPEPRTAIFSGRE